VPTGAQLLFVDFQLHFQQMCQAVSKATPTILKKHHPSNVKRQQFQLMDNICPDVSFKVSIVRHAGNSVRPISSSPSSGATAMRQSSSAQKDDQID